MPLVYHYFQQYISYVVAVNFNCEGNQSIQRKPPTCRKLLTNFSNKRLLGHYHMLELNLQLH